MPLLAVLACKVALSTWTGYAADPRFPWLPPALNLAYREGVLLGYPDDAYMRGGRLPSRYEYAVVAHAVAQTQLELAEKTLRSPYDDVDRAKLIRCACLLPVYVRAGAEFRKELTSLGITGDLGRSRLAELTRQIAATSPARDRLFRDVPADHWAAKAVGDLRALGLLDGYPDGRFRG